MLNNPTSQTDLRVDDKDEKDLKFLIKNLEQKLNKIVAKRELEIYRSTKKKYIDDRTFTKINNWVNSSAVRSAFARLTLLAFYEKKYVSIDKVTFQLNISRPAAKTMIDYCLSEEWIRQDSFGGIQASPFSETAFSYYVKKLSGKTYDDLEQFYSLSVAIKAIQESLETKNS